MARQDEPRETPEAVDPDAPGAGEDVCRMCGGTGLVDGEDCPDCGGTGVVTTGIGGA